MALKKPRSLREALEDKLSAWELSMVPRSFDVVGDIAVIEFPEELAGKEKVIADALIKTFRNINVVVEKTSEVSGEYRTRGLRVIAGESRTTTVHKEYGLRYAMDLKSAYFSPRLGTERARVAEKVKKGEKVLVMFAGVGPYAILISKKSDAGEVYAVELNHDAVEYMKENIKLNKAGNVFALEGDAGVKVPELVNKAGKFDRIIMPLPKDAGSFLDAALPALRENGTIHFYYFARDPGEAVEKVREISMNLGYEIEILEAVECGSYSPCLSRICIDFKIK